MQFAKLHSPLGMCFAPDGSLCVTEHMAGNVTVFDKDLTTVLQRIGRPDANKPGRLCAPWGVVVSDDMTLAVTELGKHRVSQFALADGSFIRTFGEYGRGLGQFSQPRGICIDNNGDYIVADTGNSRLQRFTAAGEFMCVFATTCVFKQPVGLAFNYTTGDVVCCNSGSNSVVFLRADGSVRKQFGELGMASGFFDDPRGVCLDGECRLIVLDAHNNRLQIFDADGEFVDQLFVQQPQSCIINHNGHIFFADGTGRLSVVS
jgi:DNA-binding beta-propeller fold protein YncE